MSVYSSSKAAVRSFARTFTTDLKDRKIRVNAISPGVIPSPGYRNSLGMTAEQVKQYADSAVSKTLGRTGTLDEVAKVVSFLASDESSYVNPTVYSVAEFKSKLASANHFLNAVLKGKRHLC
jgi:NAD(P)-dependent dehydrogenase (short-subunit alcohol dehydrogenase family)